MDVESRNFKSYQQVPKWWSMFVTAGVISALVVAIIALAVGSAAMREANSSEETTVYIDDDAEVTERGTEVTNEAANEPDTRVVTQSEDTPGGEMTADRVLPGNENYTGYTHVPRPRTNQYFDIVTHGHVSDSYFAYLQKGVDDAAQQLGVDVLYLDAEDPDETSSHSEIIDNILNARRSLKNGLAVSFLEHTPELGRELNEAAVDMPVLSMLLDEDLYEDIGINTFANLGFNYERAGAGAGRKFTDLGVESPLCLLNADSPFGDDDACNAFMETAENGITNRIETNGDGVVTNVAAIVTDNDIDGILAVGSDTFEAAYAYLEENDLLCSIDTPANESDCILLAAFGENEQILNGIVDGSVSFTYDRQLYLQGYLSVLFLFMRSLFHFEPGAGRSVSTGPVLIETVEEAERRLRRDIMASQTIQNKTAADLDIRFVVHGKTSDPFWNSVKSGIRFAARETGVRIDFRHPDSDAVTSDAVIESLVRMINEAADDNVEALITTLPSNDSTLIEALEEFSQQTGNPIITVNAGHRWFIDLQLPIQAHIGMASLLEGRDVAERLSEANVRRKVLCVIYERGNQDLEERCQSIGANETELEVIILDSTEDQDFHAGMNNRDRTIRDAVVDQLNNDSDIQAVVSSGLLATQACREALALLDMFCIGDNRPRNNRQTCIEFAAYDVDPHVFTYIKNDEMLFAVDQQPALQGALPIYFAMIDALYGNQPVGLISTGPLFVDITNVELEEFFYGFFTS